MQAGAETLEVRARLTGGSSSDAIYRMVASAIRARGIHGGRLVDVGCGKGALWSLLRDQFSSYWGMDAVRYGGFPSSGEFQQADFDRSEWPINANVADLVVSLETIEHVENPWAFMRGLARIAKPGAWLAVTTPNQLSWLSLSTLLVRRRFAAFPETYYPIHRTALLESDLRHAAEDCGLQDIDILYTHSGRIPKTAWHYPDVISNLFPRGLSDNLMVLGRKPRD